MMGQFTLYVTVLLAILCTWTYAELTYSVEGETREYWNNRARDELKSARNLEKNIAVAKNVILFIGDGMGVSTVTAARILKGQLEGRNGEEGYLSFERFPKVGMTKTYNQDAQTPDSAGTATAFLCGVKTNMGTMGIDARGRRGQCETSIDTRLTSILDWSKDAGKSTGIVTTTRITHATPAAAFAHTPERNWESDGDMVGVSPNCTDIAKQLIDENHHINVILGGGRRAFVNKSESDPEDTTAMNRRLDGRNLIQDWQNKMAELNRTHSYVWNMTDFNAVDPQNTDYLLGLFNPSHMEYEADRLNDIAGEPSLEQMVEKALQILSKNPNGYFLEVEGGRIDHAHHESNAKRSLHDTLAFERAVAKAVEMTSDRDTLIIVSADHSHVFTIGGYPTRGNPIMGLTDDRMGSNAIAADGKPYTTLLYSNGPGAFNNSMGPRPDPSNMDTNATNYIQQAAVFLSSETHSAEDVAIYARGPMSHLFHGIHEQNYIAHVMGYASCVGPYSDESDCATSDVMNNQTNGSPALKITPFYIFICAFLFSRICLAHH